VIQVAGSDGIIGGQNWTNNVRAQGSNNSLLVNYLTIGHQFLDLMGITLKEGREFSNQFLSDSMNYNQSGSTDRKLGSIILNETAVKNLGIREPALGKQVVWYEDEDTTYNLEVIGIVKDFHFTTLRNEIKPFVFVSSRAEERLLTIKLNPLNIQTSISQIEKAWNNHSPDRPFQYEFLDQTFASLYQTEARFKQVFISITLIAIFISCLGLFALTSFVTTQRTKEIGIRRVLGASVTNITALLSRDFLVLILIAILVASPLAWWGMNEWLQGYAYRIDLNGWVFIISGALAFIIAIITTSIQAVKAATLNPVKSLRTE
jgi:putative ABC transport system permease protein